MTYTYLSLAALVLAIALGFIKGYNTGILCIGLAYIVGKMAGLTDAKIFSGFPSSLFLLIFGVMFLFGIAQDNGSLSLLVKKVLRLTGKQAWLLPIVLFLCTLTISGLGAGPYAILTIYTVTGVALAKELHVSPWVFILCGGRGTTIGSCSPISLLGLVTGGILGDLGYDKGLMQPVFLNILVSGVVMMLIFYFAFGGHKLRAPEELYREPLPKFNKEQKITLLALLIFVLVVCFCGYNPGFVGIIIAMVLVIIGVADEKKIVKSIPWSTLMMLSGVSLLVKVITETGGIELISNMLGAVVTPFTAAPFTALMAGVFSVFSVMSSVVVPTMTPILPALVEATGGGVSLVTLLTAMCFGGYATSISPLSSGGGMIMAAITGMDEKDGGQSPAKVFKTLIILAVIQMAVSTIFGFTPLFSIFQ